MEGSKSESALPKETLAQSGMGPANTWNSGNYVSEVIIHYRQLCKGGRKGIKWLQLSGSSRGIKATE